MASVQFLLDGLKKLNLQDADYSIPGLPDAQPAPVPSSGRPNPEAKPGPIPTPK
jgi:hypothetical protein